MAKYIEATGFKQSLERQYLYCHGYSGKNKEVYKEAILAVKSMVKTANLVEAEPVQHGQWYKPIGRAMPPEHHGRYRCSVCDEMAFYERPGREELSNYCPCCGAKMNGGKDDG